MGLLIRPALLLLFLLAGRAAAQPLDPARLIGLPVVGEPALSPDGRWLAFTVSFADTVTNANRAFLWLAPTDGRSPPRPLGGEDHASRPRWSPDSRHLAWLSEGQIHARLAGDGETRVVTRASGGVLSYQWWPDGSSFLYLARGAVADSAEDPAAPPGFDAVVEGPDRRPGEFWRQPLHGGAATRLLRADPGVRDWDLSSDGGRLVYASNGTGLDDDENRFDLWLLDPIASGAPPRRLTRRFGPDTSPLFSPDGRSIAWQADQETTVTFSQEEIFVMPAGGGEPRALTLGYDAPLNGARWRADGQALWFESPRGGDNLLCEVSKNGGKTRPLFSDPPYASEVCQSRDGRVMAFVGEGPGAWPDVWIRAGRGEPRRLTRFGDALPPGDWPEASLFRWTSRDGQPLEALLLEPVTGSAPWPAVAVLHGGPFNRTPARLRSLVNSLALASRGCLVYHPQFRGSRSGTQQFGLSIRGDPGGGDLDDVLTGLDSLAAGGLVDPARVGVFGWSYGGFLATWAMAATPRFRAGVSMYGVSDFLLDFAGGRSPSYELEYLGRPWWEDRSRWIDRSPLWQVDRIRAPLLLLHGQDDPAVTVLQSRAMQRALLRLGREVELVTYPREGHGFREPNHRVDAARRIADWFDRHLK